ncbi:dynein heavy chain [Nesidiocoris tenuis]|uniref:Dynein heavy chain n=1 Tax=Nesidiocoris tenuis TaxID=355587 RepID=A0ABN7ACE8_9HEMI|nr:dynein heavy chain [Nesidiocoris tenuis]
MKNTLQWNFHVQKCMHENGWNPPHFNGFLDHSFSNPTVFPDDENKVRRNRFRVIVSGFADDPRRMEKNIVILFRTRNNFNADSKTFPEEYYVHKFVIGDSNPVLGLSFILESVMKPNIMNSNQWGILAKVPEGPKRRNDFLADFNGFVRYMNCISYDQKQRITFEMTPDMAKALTGEPRISLSTQVKNLKTGKPAREKKTKDKQKSDKLKKAASVKAAPSAPIVSSTEIKKSLDTGTKGVAASASTKKTPQSQQKSGKMAAKNQASAKATAEEQKRLRLRQSQRRRDMRFKKRLKTMLSKVKRRRGERRILEKAFKDKLDTLELKVCFTRKLRGEPGLATPDAELEHWMHIITIFNDALEFNRSKDCQDYLRALTNANSPLVKKWNYCLRFCQLNRNYAVDNLIYLNLCRVYWWAVNKSTPKMISMCLPGILAAFKQIFSIEKYRAVNKPSGFLRKVTNQMITACSNYITDNNRSSVWKLQKSIVLDRITDCMRLYLDYCGIYHDMNERAKLEGANSGKEVFAGSDIFVIGKFLSFKNRLAKIADVISTRLAFSILEDSRIRGVSKVARRVKRAYDYFPKTNHNLMDYRDVKFDVDYVQFKEKIKEQEEALQALMKKSLMSAPNMPVWCLYLKRWDKITLDCLPKSMIADHAYTLYMTEVTKLRDLYNKRRRNPGIPKLIAPIAARLLWIQSLTARITSPLEVMKSCQLDTQLPWTQNGIKIYNSLLRTFCLFEMIHREVIYKKFALVCDKMTQPLLKAYPKKGYKINFHPVIREFFDETEHIYVHGHPISSAQYLDLQLMKRMLWSYEMLTILLEKFIKIKKSVPHVFCNIGKPLMNQLDTHFRPFFKKVTWKTLSIVSDLHEVNHVLDDALWFQKTTTDIMEARFNVPCQKIENSVFIYVSPLTVGHRKLLRQNLAYQASRLQELQIISENMEITVVELINRFVMSCKDKRVDQTEKWNWYNNKRIMIKSSSVAEIELDPKNFIHKKYTPKSTAQFAFECMEVYNYFNQQRVEAVATATRQSLALLNERIRGIVRSKKFKTILKVGVPIFFTNVILQHPKVRISPSLMEVQMTVNKIVTGAMRIARDLKPWGFYNANTYVDAKTLAVEAVEEKNQRRSEYHPMKSAQPERRKESEKKRSNAGHRQDESQMDELSESEVDLPPLKETSPKQFDSEGRTIITLYRAVYSNKDVVRQIVLLQGQFLIIAKEVDSILAEFARYRKMWVDNKEAQSARFLLFQPASAYIREKFIAFDKIEQEIRALHDTDVVLPMLVSSNYFYSALYTEIQKWREALGSELKKTFRGIAEEVADFINIHTAIMHRPVHNLATVRTQMQCLKEIRDGFVEVDQELVRIEEVYATLQQYNIKIPYNDLELVYGLRYSFTKMNKLAASMQSTICELQKPLKKELMTGLAEFKTSLEQFDHDFEVDGPMKEGLTAKEASDRVAIMQGKFDDLWERFELLRSGQELFGMEKSDFPSLMDRKKEFNLLQKLYGLYNQVNRVIDGYYNKVWTSVDIEKINEELTDFQNKCRKLPRVMKDWPAFVELKKKIDDFTESCPLLEMMANPSMKERHWVRLENLLKCKFDVESPDFTLGDIMAAPLLKNKDEVEDICISAVKEKDIDAKLKQVQGDWTNVNLQFSHFKNRGELLVKGAETTEIINLIEDSMMILSSLLSNRYNAPFRKEIQLWCNNLSQTGEILENWMAVQNLWIYLEAVFVGGDIAKQLPAEAKRFANIDRSWVKLMQRAHEFSSVIDTCVGDDSMAKLLPFLLEQLESCQKSLTGYLEQKRLAFPRFFFISDPALLEILGQSSDSHAIQPHLLSLFENVAKLRYSKRERDRVLQIVSKEDEKISLSRSFLAQGGIEHWLGTLLKLAKSSLGGIIGACYDFLGDPEFRILKMLEKFPAQVGLLGLQIWWTKESERALREWRYDPRIFKKTNKYFLNILNVLIDQTARELTKFERIKFETLVTIHVHQKDIFEDLTIRKVRSPLDFEWTKQERFYYNDETDDCLVKVTDVVFIYQNEYMGCTDRLVITPLTDRCYITLAQAIGMSMGGAPAGPAGTGKTETTKDMGKSLGKYVVVFNCSDQMDFRGLGRIFKGLAQSGSWGCFDEFNRIELPVLSVAAQQISIVLMARKEKATHFIFSDGDRVRLDPEFGLFITMNPGYAGRQELPENLKINFRTVAMMVPDRQIIMRVKLASCGFRGNQLLARKFFVLYKLCEEQLSKQVHYDFGLRNILSVLRTLGAQKRANPTETEDTTLMRVLRDMNVSKLVDEDEPLFLSLIEDLFVGLKLTTSVYKQLQGAIESTCEEMGLTNYPEWNLKIIQLYETSLVRHGLMTMGPTGSGKTRCIHTLLTSFTKCGRPHKEMRMNPKAITAPQMFGRLDVATNDWTDGIFSTLWRRSLKIRKDENVWIVLDGPVDAVWIENLNSVLDDNKTLTLANGDRIVMAPNSKLVFEPDNVDNASPATVSRMGMVFLSSSVLPWGPILDGWLKKRKANERNIWRPILDKIYQDAYECVSQRLAPKMRILEALYIRQTCDLLDGLVPKPGVPAKSYSNEFLERIILMAIMWSLGAVLELEDRAKLEDLLLNHKSKLKWPSIRADESIFEYLVGSDGQWVHWNSKVVDYEYPSDEVPEFASILVPNVDNVRTNFLIDTISKQKKAVLLIGEQGTAKTVMIKSYMSNYNPEVHLQKALNFSSATTPNMFQRIIESYVDKRVGFTFGPPYNRQMTVFIDDINMPVINAWGDQVTNEIVRQLMEVGGFYNLEKPGEFNTIQDLLFLAAMIHPGGGRNDIPHRLKRQFNIFNCTLPSGKSMDKIFGILGEGYFCSTRFRKEVVTFIPHLVPLTRILWQRTKTKMLPTPAKFHYVFNLRDLSRIWEGMMNIKGPECEDPVKVLKLWKHECERVISDRFTNPEDKSWFLGCISAAVEEFIQTPISQGKIPQLRRPVKFENEECYFVDFLRDAPEPTGEEESSEILEAPKIYEEVPSWKVLKEKLLYYMAGYNETVRGNKMDMVFFHDAMVHLMIISRIIRTARGSALLVGVGGSGKQSLTKMATYMAGYTSHQITLTRIYSVNNFLEDVKHLYRIAGGKCQGISFIFTDNDIKDEAFLEYLNNILSSGEVANLFTKEENDTMCNDLVLIMKKMYPKRTPTLEKLYEFFIQQARKNLHIVLCFSPVSEKFRSRALKFPGLISGCTIDWFSRWPRSALVEVAHHFLDEYQMVCSLDAKNKTIALMGLIQDEVADACNQYFDRFRRRTYVTPKSFLSFLEGYKTIYSQRNNEIKKMRVQMTTGLNKLAEAAESVVRLKAELIEGEKDIAIANAKAEEILKEVTAAAAEAMQVQAEVKAMAESAQILVRDIAKDKKAAEDTLEKARPALEAAEAALLTIKAADIATVRKLGKPPYLITVIMDAVLLLFNRKVIHPMKLDKEKNFVQMNWAESLKVMGDSKFLFNLQNYPKDAITGEMVDLLKPYLRLPTYTFESAKQACGNVAGLLQWTKAMCAFYNVNKEVIPLKANLAALEGKLDKAQKQLARAEEMAAEKERELKAVQEQADRAIRAKQEIQEKADRCQHKMNQATSLINGLAGEQKRWTAQLQQFKAETDRLVGDVILLTGFLSYCGPFNQEFRVMLQRQWVGELLKQDIPFTHNLKIVDLLVDAATIGEWNIHGLPNDELSIQNGIISTKAARYPLLIDPQNQGSVWIKNKEAGKLKVSGLNKKYFRQDLEECLSLGKTLLIEDIFEELDPVLDNVLEKNYVKVGTSLKVKLSDKEVDVDKNFRLFITTKLGNPSYSPEISARTSIIDFTVTMKGLEDQLLGRVIMKEKAELETERTQLVTDVTNMKRKMIQLEANLLHKLTTVEGSLVDDESVLEVLNTTQSTAGVVRSKLETAAETELKINLAREEYRPVAARGSVLYFLVVEMSLVNCMYQTSLVQFLDKFDISMDRSEKSPMLTKRIESIIEFLTYEIFRYTSRGLYENHKFLFVLMLALKIDMHKGKVTHEEFQIFIKGGAALNLNAVEPKPAYAWITDTMWLNMIQLSKLDEFEYLPSQLSSNEKPWRQWYQKAAPEAEELPDRYEALDTFRKTLIIRSLCPDRLLLQAQKYIRSSLGKRYTDAVILDLEDLYKESKPKTPMICFLTMGADPTTAIEALAKRLEFGLGAISMGQGQEVHARVMMKSSMEEGKWLLLQNCHLGIQYMHEVFDTITTTKVVNEGFRLWITTEPTPAFPISVLHISHKFTNDPPQGE